VKDKENIEEGKAGKEEFLKDYQFTGGHRFTIKNLSDEAFMYPLPDPYKHLLYIILESCEVGGFWVPDFRLAKFKMGREDVEIDPQKALQFYKGLVVELKGRWWVPLWLKMQYSKGLNVNVGQQVSHYKAVAKHGINWMDYQYLLQSPIELFKEIIGETTPTVTTTITTTAFKEEKLLKEEKEKKENEDGGNKLGWVLTNYPRGDQYSEEEKKELQDLLDTWEGLIGFEKIKEIIRARREGGQMGLSPLMPFIVYQINEQKSAKKLA